MGTQGAGPGQTCRRLRGLLGEVLVKVQTSSSGPKLGEWQTTRAAGLGRGPMSEERRAGREEQPHLRLNPPGLTPRGLRGQSCPGHG